MKLIACRNKKTKLICIKNEGGGRTQYTTWSMLKMYYKNHFGITLPALWTLSWDYTDVMGVEDCAIFSVSCPFKA